MKLSLFPDDVIEHYNLRDKAFPDDIIKHYNLREKASLDGTVYLNNFKEMHGLPAAGLLAQELLKKRLVIHRYCQNILTPGLWKHNTRPISFSFIVDNFGVEYV